MATEADFVPEIETAEQFGFVVYGPMVFRFMAFLLAEARSSRIDAMRFLSREGWFLGRLYNALLRVTGDRSRPAARYFHSSRRCILAVRQAQGVDPEPILEGAGFHGTISSFLTSRLNVDLPRSEVFQRVIRLPGDDDVVRQTLRDVGEVVSREGNRQAIGLMAYCQGDGLLTHSNVGFVDIGYSATVQRGLQNLLSLPLRGLYMAVSHVARRTGDQGGSATGCFGNGDSELRDFTENFGLLLEAVLTAPHGQVISFSQEGVPGFREGGLAQGSSVLFEQLYLGIEAYAFDAVRSHGPGVLDGPFDDGAALRLMRAVRTGQLRVSDDLKRAMSVEDDFCGMGEIPVFQTTKPVSEP